MNSIQIQELLYELKKLWVKLSLEERQMVENCDSVFFYTKNISEAGLTRLGEILAAHEGKN